jgi:hypothetical protein
MSVARRQTDSIVLCCVLFFVMLCLNRHLLCCLSHFTYTHLIYLLHMTLVPPLHTHTDSVSITAGFQDYTICASYDRKYWFRLPTSFSPEGALHWEHASKHDQVYFAYFAPFRCEWTGGRTRYQMRNAHLAASTCISALEWNTM